MSTLKAVLSSRRGTLIGPLDEVVLNVNGAMPRETLEIRVTRSDKLVLAKSKVKANIDGAVCDYSICKGLSSKPAVVTFQVGVSNATEADTDMIKVITI